MSSSAKWSVWMFVVFPAFMAMMGMGNVQALTNYQCATCSNTFNIDTPGLVHTTAPSLPSCALLAQTTLGSSSTATFAYGFWPNVAGNSGGATFNNCVYPIPTCTSVATSCDSNGLSQKTYASGTIAAVNPTTYDAFLSCPNYYGGHLYLGAHVAINSWDLHQCWGSCMDRRNQGCQSAWMDPQNVCHWTSDGLNYPANIFSLGYATLHSSQFNFCPNQTMTIGQANTFATLYTLNPSLAPVSSFSALSVIPPSSTSFPTAIVLYNYGYGGALQAARGGGTFNIISLDSAVSDVSSQFQIYITDCDIGQNVCNYNYNSTTFPNPSDPNSISAFTVAFTLGSSNSCQLNIWGGYSNTKVGNPVRLACGGTLGNNEVFAILPAGGGYNNLYQIRGWNTKNGAVCLRPTAGSGQPLTFAGCDFSDISQLWAFYQVSN